MPKNNKKGVDKSLLIGMILLLAVGTIMVFSSSTQNDLMSTGDPFYTLKKQILWVLIGTTVALITSKKIYYRWTRSLWKPIFGVTIGALIVVLFMPAINGSKRWLGIGSYGIQPSELAKLVTIIFFAKMLSEEKESLKGLIGIKTLVKKYAFMPLMLFGLVIIEPNMSTASIIVLIVIVMLLIGGLGMNIFLPVLGAGITTGVALILTSPYRLERVQYLINPWKDTSDAGWQLVNSLLAVGSGRLFGLGLGQSREKCGYLPMANTDFIYSITCEELGLVGAVFIIILFVFLVYRMVKIAFSAPDKYSFYLVSGITVWIVLQMILHMLIAVGFFPVTGVPLPFISYGGSSMLILMLAMGLVLNVSKYSKIE